MKPSFLLASGSAVLAAAAAVACAATGNNEGTAPDGGGGPTVVPIEEGGSPIDADVDVQAEASAPGAACSAAGWCETTLPDADLVMLDLWPLAARAFAIAESRTLGIKVLEWSDATSSWAYIDDGTQNEPGLGTFAGKIWAPSENALFYGVGPGYVYHGTRTDPTAPWSWSRHRLQDNSHPGVVHPADGSPRYDAMSRLSYPALGVWGTSSTDVYAWFTNTIYHWKSAGGGGAPEWVPEYTADDAADENEHLFFVSAGGASASDVWFSGARRRATGSCALLVRKTAAGFERVADGVPAFECTPKPDVAMIGGAEGWLTDLQASGTNQVVGLKGARDAVRISVGADGSYGVELATVTPPVEPSVPPATRSLWTVANESWTSRNVLVFRTKDLWASGAREISSIAIHGTPNVNQLYLVRGTSNSNLWAIGERNALHKTTP